MKYNYYETMKNDIKNYLEDNNIILNDENGNHLIGGKEVKHFIDHADVLLYKEV